MPRSVLVVDDNKVNQTVLSRILQKRGIETVIANHGLEALNFVRSSKFDFILMDLEMPTMDGFEAIRLIRELEETHQTRIPIVAVTAFSARKIHLKALTAGADDLVLKPIHSEHLFGIMAEVILRLHPNQDCLAIFPELAREILLHQALAETFQRIGNDSALLQEIIESFTTLYKTWQDEVASAREQHDVVAVHVKAKELVSSARNIVVTPSMLFATHSTGPSAWTPNREELAEICRSVGEDVEQVVKFTDFFIARRHKQQIPSPELDPAIYS